MGACFNSYSVDGKTTTEELRTDAAYEWLADNTRKWDNAKAVQYMYEGVVARWMIGGWCAE